MNQALAFSKGVEYFVRISHVERDIVRGWLSHQFPLTKAQKVFLDWVEEALFFIGYEYRIATLEPSMDEDGNLYYGVNKPVCVGLTFNEWKEKAKKFSVEGNSDLATVYELFLWYAYRIACGHWSLNFVCNNSSKGNYKDSPGATHSLEHSGARVIGGARDGVGNTIKIVSDASNFGMCGGDYTVSGRKFPVADFLAGYNAEAKCANSVGVVVLRK